MTISDLGIATATRCSCGAPVHVSVTGGAAAKAWQALCRQCYDGTEDAGERAHVRGFGATPDAALWDWQCVHDEAHEVEWYPVNLFDDLGMQLHGEAMRQMRWGYSPATDSPADPRTYGPAEIR